MTISFCLASLLRLLPDIHREGGESHVPGTLHPLVVDPDVMRSPREQLPVSSLGHTVCYHGNTHPPLYVRVVS